MSKFLQLVWSSDFAIRVDVCSGIWKTSADNHDGAVCAIKENVEKLEEPIDGFIDNLLKIIPNIMPNTNGTIIVEKINVKEGKIDE